MINAFKIFEEIEINSEKIDIPVTWVFENERIIIPEFGKLNGIMRAISKVEEK